MTTIVNRSDFLIPEPNENFMDIPPVPHESETPLAITVDAEHLGIRTLLPTMLIAGLIGGYWLGSVIKSLIDPTLPTLCVGLPVAIVTASILLQITEKVIKPMWKSKRAITLNQKELVYSDQRRKSNATYTFIWENPFEIQAWYFEVRKGGRVPKGWYCASIALSRRIGERQERVIFYAFVNPEKVHKMELFRDYFALLLPRKQREALVATDPVEATRQTLLRDLEGSRWFDGAEISAENLFAIVSVVDRIHP
jgi:hypothetical protein